MRGRDAARACLAAAGTALLVLLAAEALPAQTRDRSNGDPGSDVPPPGDIVAPERNFAVGLGLGALRWDDEAPYDDFTLASVNIERRLWRGIRGRAGLGTGSTTLLGESPQDTNVYLVDLQLVVGADFGPFAAAGVIPYAVAGVGSVVTDPSGADGANLPTRSQSQLTWGGGVLARLGDRWEAKGEMTQSDLRLADPFNSENSETDTIHNSRWEGRISWIF